jgi:hypothetical protein
MHNSDQVRACSTRSSTARSHGCIRLANSAIDWLVHSIGARQVRHGAEPAVPALNRIYGRYAPAGSL